MPRTKHRGTRTAPDCANPGKAAVRAGRPARERADAARNRRRLLEAARALLERRAGAAIRMEEIAEAAGVGVGTLYRRYPHKGALYLDLLREDYAHFAAEVERVANGPEPPADRLDQVVAMRMRFQERNLPILYEAKAAWAARSEQMLQQSAGWQFTRGILAGLLSEMGVPDPEVSAALLMGVLEADLFRYLRTLEGRPLGRIRNAVGRLLHGLRAASVNESPTRST